MTQKYSVSAQLRPGAISHIIVHMLLYNCHLQIYYCKHTTMPCQVSQDMKARIPVLFYEFALPVKKICNILGIQNTLIYNTRAVQLAWSYDQQEGLKVWSLAKAQCNQSCIPLHTYVTQEDYLP